MLRKIKGIVISETPFKESSKIINILCEEGIIGVISKGCKNIKSPLRIVSNKFIYAEYDIYYNENKLSTLKEGNVINNFNYIKNDLILISYMSYITELVSQIVKQNNNPDIFKLYLSTLNKMNEKLNPLVLTNILEIKLLDYLGVGISLNGCAICGGTKNIVTIDPDKGGYICSNCYTNEMIYDKTVQKMIRMYYLVELDSLSDLKIKEETINSINRFINMYYDRFTGLYLKSKEFLDKDFLV